MRIEKRRRRTGFAMIAIGTALSLGAPAQMRAAVPPLEGVWKITMPATSLKPVSGAVPFTAEGRKAFAANIKARAERRFDDYDITTSRCSNPGIPRLALTPLRFKIWSQLNAMTFDYEWNGAIRQINMGVARSSDPLGRDQVPTMTGKSNGHWEGDTLVAVTDGFSDRTLLDDLVPHDFDLKVTERFRLIDADTLEDRITIEDPAYFTRPWDAVVTYARQPDAIFPEDICLDRLAAQRAAAQH